MFRSKAIKRAYLKMLRRSNPPEYVARGIAIGLFTAFFIPFSVQMPTAFLISFWLRASRIAALLFTWITNPFSIPFIYPIQCYIGSKIIQQPLTYSYIKHHLAAIIETPSLKLIAELGTELVFSFLVGGLLFGSIAAIIGYHASLPWIRLHHKKRDRRKERRKQRAAAAEQLKMEISAK